MSITEGLVKRRQSIIARKIEVTNEIAKHRKRHGIGTTPIALREEAQSLDLELAGIKIILEALGLSDRAIDQLSQGKTLDPPPFDDEIATIATTVGYLDRQHRNARTDVASFRDTLSKKDTLVTEADRVLRENRHRFAGHDSSCNCGLCCLNRAHMKHEDHEKGRGQAAEYAKRGREHRKVRETHE